MNITAAGVVSVIFLACAAAVAATDDLLFLDNGHVRLGIDRQKGGAITWLSSAEYPKNMINIHDPGRLIQQSYYAGRSLDRRKEGQSNAWSPWPWNPIQGGGVASWSRVAEFKRDGAKLYSKSIPKLWDMPNEEATATMKQWIHFDEWVAYAVVVRCEFFSEREPEDRWGSPVPRHQEIPACYFTRNFASVRSYLGNHEWRDEPTSPGPPWRQTMPPRRSMALFSSDGFGVAVFSPASTQDWNYGPHAGGSSDDAVAAPCMHIAPLDEVSLAPRSMYAYRYWLVVGSEKTIAECLDRLWTLYQAERAIVENR